MELRYQGKTKDVYEREDGRYVLQFKDDATGEDGVFDPGANTVGLSIEGLGRAGLRMTRFFFEKIRAAGIPTHYVDSDIEAATMVVLPCTAFGAGLEVICRYRAVGSFLRRYGAYIAEGAPLDALVEMTLKDDDRGDPLATRETLEALGILQPGEYERLSELTKRICAIVKEELAQKGIELYDIKLEFGRAQGQVVLMDEISAGNMRAYRDGAIMPPLELARAVLG